VKCRIAFQGEPGAFSQIAALRFGGDDCTPVPVQTFEEIFISVQNGKNKYAAIPIENTLHGSVHENYDHLLKYDLCPHRSQSDGAARRTVLPTETCLFTPCCAESMPALL
jgi:prephenate dehydratase